MDLTTRTTVDVEAWRARMDDRRAEAARHRALDAAVLVAARTPRPRKPRAVRPPKPRPSRALHPRPVSEPVRPCDGCRRPTRSNHLTAAEAPGTVPRVRDGKCRQCLPRTPHTPRPRQSRRDPARTAAIIAAYTAGARVRQLCADHDLSPCTVRRIIHDSSAPFRDERGTGSGGANRMFHDPVLAARVRALYVGAGQSMNEVADALGIGVGTVSRVVHYHGIPAHPQAARRGADRAQGLRARMAAEDVTSADVRAWARENDVPVYPVGLPSAALVEAYIAEHRGASA